MWPANFSMQYLFLARSMADNRLLRDVDVHSRKCSIAADSGRPQMGHAGYISCVVGVEPFLQVHSDAAYLDTQAAFGGSVNLWKYSILFRDGFVGLKTSSLKNTGYLKITQLETKCSTVRKSSRSSNLWIRKPQSRHSSTNRFNRNYSFSRICLFRRRQTQAAVNFSSAPPQRKECEKAMRWEPHASLQRQQMGKLWLDIIQLTRCGRSWVQPTTFAHAAKLWVKL